MEIKDGKLLIKRDELVKLISKELACDVSYHNEKCRYGQVLDSGPVKKVIRASFENCIAYQLIALYNPDVKARGEERKEFIDNVLKKDPIDDEAYDRCPIWRDVYIHSKPKEYAIEQMFSNLKIEILEG